MSRHPDFEEILKSFILKYGTEKGTKIYYSYLYNENLIEEEPMSAQKMDFNTPENSDGFFDSDDVLTYPSLLQINGSLNDSLVIGFKSDAIENNFETIKKSIEQIMKLEKERYIPIINQRIEQVYNEGIREAARELSMSVEEFGNIRNRKEQIRILKENSEQLAFTLLDDITKNLTLKLTDASLNNISFTNPELKKEVSELFKSKIARLQSQVVSETDRSFNTALEFGYKESGVVVKKQWVAIIDDRTTSICRTLNGEVVDIGEPFSLGFFTPPAHVNCRSRIKALTISEIEGQN